MKLAPAPMGKQTTAVYFSGAPTDISIENECIPFFSKAGLLMVDLLTEQPKIKLYKDKENQNKSETAKTVDGLAMYLRPESVSLAELLLDGVEIRDGFPIKIQKATFDDDERKKSNSSSGSIVKKTSVQKAVCSRTLEKMQKKLDWSLDEEGNQKSAADKALLKASRTLILKNMYTIDELDKEPQLLLDLKEDVRNEAERKIGGVSSVQIYDGCEGGIIGVRFKEENLARAAQVLFHGRFFNKRQIQAEIYDQSFKLIKRSSVLDEEEEEERLDKYSKFLESSTNVQ